MSSTPSQAAAAGTPPKKPPLLPSSSGKTKPASPKNPKPHKSKSVPPSRIAVPIKTLVGDLGAKDAMIKKLRDELSEYRDTARKGPWQENEDNLLTRVLNLVNVNEEVHSKWRAVAEYVPGRSAKQCRERWAYNLDPNINKSPWTKEEDDILLSMHQRVGNRWASIAQQLEGRTENAVKTRHKSLLRAKKRAWTPQEDRKIRELHRQHGSRWDVIADKLKPRTRNAIKCRYKQLVEMDWKGDYTDTEESNLGKEGVVEGEKVDTISGSSGPLAELARAASNQTRSNAENKRPHQGQQQINLGDVQQQYLMQLQQMGYAPLAPQYFMPWMATGSEPESQNQGTQRTLNETDMANLMKLQQQQMEEYTRQLSAYAMTQQPQQGEIQGNQESTQSENKMNTPGFQQPVGYMPYQFMPGSQFGFFPQQGQAQLGVNNNLPLASGTPAAVYAPVSSSSSNAPAMMQPSTAAPSATTSDEPKNKKRKKQQ